MTAHFPATAPIYEVAFAVLMLCAPASVCAASIPDSAAALHVDQTATVQGTISNVHVSAKGTVFINFGRPYPNQDFTAVIFASSVAGFGDVNRLQGRHAQVSGQITIWKGKPEMILRSPAQLHLLP